MSRLTALARSVWWRAYQDYLMPNRLPEYRRLLESALAAGYRAVSVEQWANIVAQGDVATRSPLLVLRHDIDTDPDFSLSWSQVERELGAHASYFFRQSTLSPTVIEEVMHRGMHVSYHFEELADVAKEQRLHTREAVMGQMPAIQQRFARNLDHLRRRFGWDGRIVCSHGDWMNRFLGISNHALLEDRDFRASVGVTHETYDEALMAPLAGYYTDAMPPVSWRRSGNPAEGIASRLPTIGVLTHPRQWRPSPRCNTIESGRRIREALAFRM